MLGGLHVGYLNVQGLTLDKWHVLTSLLSTDAPPTGTPSLDLLFLAETWFVQDTYQRCLAHPALVVASPLLHRRQGMRQKGGLLALASPRARSLLSGAASTEHTLTLSLLIQGAVHGISAVYYPPSMSPADMAGSLLPLSSSSLILGDVNTRFGATWSDTVSGPPERLLRIQQFQAQASFLHVRPSSGFARVDHVFASYASMAALHPHLDVHASCGVSTDHPLLHVALSCTAIPSSLPAASDLVTRYNSRFLDFEPTQQQLIGTYDALWQVAPFSHHAATSDWTQASVDVFDEWLLAMVSEACEEVLGSYDPLGVQAQRDTLLGDRDGPPRAEDAALHVRIFKRACRASRHERLLSARPPSTLSAVDDAVAYYSDLYAPPDLLLPEVDLASDVASPELLGLFEERSIWGAIKRYPSSKSPGADGINGKIVKCLSHSAVFMTHLTLLFRLCVRSGRTPARWNESLIFPIPKDPDIEAPTIADMRPISLTAMFRRIFESILLEAVSSHEALAGLRAFHRGQSGFRRNFSCLAQVLVSHDSANLGYDHKVFLDLKNAYDRVPIPLVLGKLAARTPPPGLLSLIDALFGSCSSRCVVNRALGPSFPRRRGLFQGSLLSPWLFNVFIDDLACDLNSASPLIPKALFFADDIQLQAKRPADLPPMLAAVDRWTRANGMLVNLSKSAYLAPPGTLDNQSINVDSQLPRSEAYTYLGFPHRNSGVHLEQHVRDRISHATSVLNFCRFSGRLDHLSERVRLNIYKTFIRPTLEYGAPLVAQWLRSLREQRPPRGRHKKAPLLHLWKHIEAVQDSALVWIFQVSRFTVALRSLSGLGCLQDRFEELAARYTRHLGSLAADHPLRSIHATAPASSLSRRCLEHPLAHLVVASASHTKLRFSKLRLDTLASSSLLSSRIAWPCRHPRSFYDRILSLPSRPLRRLALSWRLNTFGRLEYCTACSSPFSTSHISACALLPVSASDLTDLLNHSSYDLFSKYLSDLKSLLSRTL